MIFFFFGENNVISFGNKIIDYIVNKIFAHKIRLMRVINVICYRTVGHFFNIALMVYRWGPDGVDVYKDNMKKLMLLLDDCLPKKTLFIWTTTLPVSNVLRGGLLIKQVNTFCIDLLPFI